MIAMRNNREIDTKKRVKSGLNSEIRVLGQKLQSV
jgi:hypothetical protein